APPRMRPSCTGSTSAAPASRSANTPSSSSRRPAMGERPPLATISADSAIQRTYLERTPAAAAMIERAARSIPAGSTRDFGYFRPYPLTFERGDGPYLWDLDGNRYVDFTYNGLSLIHGHAFTPVEEALYEVIPNGTAWPGTSGPQVAFAELL